MSPAFGGAHCPATIRASIGSTCTGERPPRTTGRRTRHSRSGDPPGVGGSFPGLPAQGQAREKEERQEPGDPGKRGCHAHRTCQRRALRCAPAQQLTNYAYGYVSIPFVWRNLGTKSAVIPSSGKVSAIVQSENLDLKRLAQDLGIKSTISGIVNARA